MADKIGSDDIGDISGFLDQVKELKVELNSIRDILVDDIKDAIKEFSKIKVDDSDSLKKFSNEQENLKKKTEALNTVNAKRHALAKEEFRLQKAKLTAQAKLIKGTKKVAKETAIINEKRKAQNKQIREQAKLQAGLVSAYDKEAKKLNDLRKRYKDLAIQKRADTKEGRELLQQITQLDNKLKGVDAKVGQFQRNVGNYGKAWEGVGSSLKKMRGQAVLAVGSLLGLNSAVQGLEQSVDAAKEFETTFTNVLTLLSSEDASRFGGMLEQGSIDLVKQYGFEIQDVNKALFDAISAGVPAGEAIEFLNQSAKLAIGGVTDLGVAVDGTTSVLNAYKLDVSETSTIQDAFFSAQKAGKTTVEELANSIGQIAPIAANANIPFQDLLASISTLTTGGLSTDEATTSLKGLLVSIQKPTAQAVEKIKELNEELGTNIPTSVSELRSVGLGQTLNDISIAGEKNADVIAEMFPNVRALTAAFALGGEGLEKYNEILNQVTNDTGEASSLTQAFSVQMETNAQKSKRLNGEIKALQIEIGKKLLPIINDIKVGIIDFVKFLGRNRKELKALLLVVGSAIATYKAYTIAVKIANNQLIKGSRLEKLVAASTRMLTVAKALLTGNIKKANVAMKAMNRTMKISPIGLLISGVAALGTALGGMASASDEAAEKQAELAKQQERLNEAIENGRKAAEDFNKEVNKEVSSASTEVDRELEKSLAGKDVTEDERQSLRKEALNKKLLNLERAINKQARERNEIIKKQNEAADEYTRFQELIAEKEQRIKEIEQRDDISRSNRRSLLKTPQAFLDSYNESAQEFLVINKEAAEQSKELGKNIDELGGSFTELQHELEITNKELDKAVDDRSDAEIKKAQDLARKRQDELDTLKRRLEDLRAENIEDDEEREIRKTELKFSREIDSVKGNSKIEKDLRIQLENDLSNEIRKIQEKFREQRKKDDFKFEENVINEELAKRKLNNIKFIESDSERRIQNLAAEQDAIQKRIDLYKEFGKDVVKLETQLATNQERIIEAKAARQEEINRKNFDQEIENIKKRQKERDLASLRNTDDQDELNNKNLDSTIKALEEEIEVRKEFGENAIDQEIELERLLRQKKQREQELTMQQQKQYFETLQNIADSFAEAQRNKDEAAIKRIDEQIAAVKKRQDTFRALAESGDLDAEKSIAAEIKREEKLEKEKERIQKRAVKRELFITGFKSLASKIEQGDKRPAISALEEMAKFSLGLAALDTFYEGTEGDKTLGQILGTPHLPGKDGYVIRADKDERIFSPSQSSKISGYTNDEVANIVKDYKGNRNSIDWENFDIDRVYSAVPEQSGVSSAINGLGYMLKRQETHLKVIADKPTYMGGDFNNATKAWEEYFAMQGKIEKKIQKLSDINW